MKRWAKTGLLLVGFLFISTILFIILVKPPNPAACPAGVVSYFRGFHDLEAASPLPDFTTGTMGEITMNGDEALPALLQAINEAEDHVHLEFMYFLDDEAGQQVAAALSQAAQRGIHVRLLFDWDLSAGSDKTGLISQAGQHRTDENIQQRINEMQAAGVQVINSFPVDRQAAAVLDQELIQAQTKLREQSCLTINHRDHRKIIVIDGKTAVFGGMNVGSHYLYEETFDPTLPGDTWHDFQVHLSGPIVTDLQEAFRQRWLISGGDAFSTSDPAYFPESSRQAEAEQTMRLLLQGPGHHEISTAYYDLIADAVNEIWIEGPYIHHDPLLSALAAATDRGVSVNLIVPGSHQDSPLTRMLMVARYQEMMAAGITIYEYDNRMLHDKVLVVDGRTTLFGSFNLNPRSFFHDLEVAVQIEDESVAERMQQALFETDLNNATRITTPPPQPWYWWLLTPAKPFS